MDLPGRYYCRPVARRRSAAQTLARLSLGLALLLAGCGSQPSPQTSYEHGRNLPSRELPHPPPPPPPRVSRSSSPPPATGLDPLTTQPTRPREPAAVPGAAGPGPPNRQPAARPRRPAELPPSVKDYVARVLDGTGWDWRAAGVTVQLRYHPRECCHWGVYDTQTRTIWIGGSARRDRHRLRYVALHELAHAWQSLSGRPQVIAADMHPWRHTGIAPAELAADCIAALWGAERGHYWRCADEARRVLARRLRNDWSSGDAAASN